MLFLSVLFESLDSITLILFCSDLHRNGCQFNMSTNVSFSVFRLYLKAGAKLEILSVSRKKNSDFFETFFFVSFFLFLFQSSKELSVFCGVQM